MSLNTYSIHRSLLCGEEVTQTPQPSSTKSGGNLQTSRHPTTSARSRLLGTPRMKPLSFTRRLAQVLDVCVCWSSKLSCLICWGIFDENRALPACDVADLNPGHLAKRTNVLPQSYPGFVLCNNPEHRKNPGKLGAMEFLTRREMTYNSVACMLFATKVAQSIAQSTPIEVVYTVWEPWRIVIPLLPVNGWFPPSLGHGLLLIPPPLVLPALEEEDISTPGPTEPVEFNATENEEQHVIINLSIGQESHHPIEEPLPEARYDDSRTTLRSFSASVSCLLGVSRACDWLLATLPVGLDLRVSTGERQNPVTCSAV
uniref:Uncharacterized protein n=1 Tax=Timema monikensis TaxID=170555 RepID=A0A7R9HNH9_9NEOP|nr:unnamed protein product [Timema monikensis]